MTSRTRQDLDQFLAEEVERRVAARLAEIDAAPSSALSSHSHTPAAEAPAMEGLPEGPPELAEIIDAPAIQALMDDFYQLARIPMSIIDLKGRVLVGVGWQRVCMEFHRAHPEACQHCIESDVLLTAGIPPGEFKLYRCKNNMWDIATPIMIGGLHVGNILSGQFFFDDEPMDEELFRAQARKYDFDEEEYIAALKNVPRLSRKAVHTGMAFLLKLAQMLSRLSFSNLNLVRAVSERDALTASLHQSRKKLHHLVTELQRSRTLLAEAERLSHTGAWEWDLLTDTWTFSDEWRRIHGTQQETLRPEELLSLAHPEDRAVIQRSFEEVREGQKPYELEHRIIRQDTGEERVVKAQGQFVEDEAGKVLRVYGFVQDITEQKRAEAALRESEEKFRNLADNISQLAWMADDNGWIFWYNQRWYEFTGTTLEDMEGWGWRRVHHPEHVERVVKKINRCFATGEVWEDTFPLQGKDGRYRWFLSRAVPIRDEQGRVRRWFGTNTDISELREAQLAMEHTAQELARSNRELEQFAYIASHDLQSPLRSITGFLDLLARRYRGKLGGEADEFISYAVQGAKRMHQLINDILAFSRVETRGEPFERVDSGVSAAQALANLRVPIEESRSEITCGALPMVSADRHQLEQLFQNLIGNAIKYRKQDEPPCIHITAAEREDNWEFRVRDNGIGIPGEQHERVFQIFQRLHTSDYPGTGIGLAICKKIVERHGGRIWVESQPGKGSIFYFTLPTS